MCTGEQHLSGLCVQTISREGYTNVYCIQHKDTSQKSKQVRTYDVVLINNMETLIKLGYFTILFAEANYGSC